MTNGIPPAYTYFRVGWSVVHIALVGTLLWLAAAWYVHDGQGKRAVSNIWAGLISMQSGFARIVPFPWEKR